MARENVIEFDLANERIILATMIHSGEQRRRITAEVTDAEFGDPKHRVIFRALTEMAKRSLAWSEDTLRDLVGRDDFGGWTFLRKLIADYDENLNVDHHLRRLRIDATKLELLTTHVPEIVSACEDPKAPIERLNTAIRAMGDRVGRTERRFTTSGKSLRDSYRSEIRARRKFGDAAMSNTGLKILDSLLGEKLALGKMSVVAARPRVGKTTFLANVIRHRRRADEGTYLCGWEVPPNDYMDMMISAETGIPIHQLLRKTASIDDDDMQLIDEITERYADPRYFEVQKNPFGRLERPKDRWFDFNARNLDFFEATVAEAAQTKTLIAVDVIGKLFAKRDPDSVSQGLVRIRQMAEDYSVHIMLLHHIGRQGADGKPTLEDIKLSGSFEEEADLILLLDRPILRASSAQARKMTNYLNIEIAKQRKGPSPLVVRYRFDGSRFALEDEEVVDLTMLEKNRDDDE